MPTFDLLQGPQTLARYDVIGEHSANSPRFVRHIALYNADGDEVNHGQRLDVVHMGPPLEPNGKIRAHVAGRVPLTSAEIARIEVWIEKRIDEYRESKPDAGRQYIIDPPWKDELDTNTGVRIYRRFSCAGFVLDAHLQVDIELLVMDKQALPEVDEQTLASGYPHAVRKWDRIADFGMEGEGPWRIVLAGYVLHALNRSGEEIRHEAYQAQVGDERF